MPHAHVLFFCYFGQQARVLIKQNLLIPPVHTPASMSRLELQDPYDIIFIDAKKSEYPGYLNSILEKSQPGQKNRMLRPGGLIVGDNVLREGLVADASEKNPATETVPKETVNWDSTSIARLDEFNKAMHENPRIEAVLLPLFDGLAIGRLLD